MSDSIRIRLNPRGDNFYVSTKIEQDFDFIELLSLKLSQKDLYKTHNSKFGVLVGRVNINIGVGVPNAKISVFIPISEVDKNNNEIYSKYPYSNVTDNNLDGIRYNLLSKKQKNDCHTPVGTFNEKREILDKPTELEIHEKYYKYTTTTNNSGDYMITGVPVGLQMIHMDVDLSDIDYLSRKPYHMIRQGIPLEKFDSTIKFKSDKNLDILPQIISQNIGVNIRPLWGDESVYEIGINQLNFNINYKIEPTAIFIGNMFGDNEKNSINKHCGVRDDVGQLCLQTTGQGTIEMIRKNTDGDIEDFNINGGMLIDKDGTWSYQIPMNTDVMITNEYGDLVESLDINIGIPTTSSVRFKISLNESGTLGRLRERGAYLVPNNPHTAYEKDSNITSNQNMGNYDFDKTTPDGYLYKLKYNNLYTVRNFIARYQKLPPELLIPGWKGYTGIKDIDDCDTYTPFPVNRVTSIPKFLFVLLCLITTVINTILYTFNKLIIFINPIIDWWNGDTIPALAVKCNDELYAPGGDSTSSQAYYNKEGKYPNITKDGFKNCISLKIALYTNVFQGEFYNDWVNGSLWGFLFKFKPHTNEVDGNYYDKNNGIFCNIDCPDNPYNVLPCPNGFLVDKGVRDGLDVVNTFNKIEIKNGLIKYYKGELYYAAATSEGNLLFATDITSLGEITTCRHDSLVLHPFLPASSGNFPDTHTDDDQELQPLVPLLINKVTCISGANVKFYNVLNARMISELGATIIGKSEDDALNTYDISASPPDPQSPGNIFSRNKLIEYNIPDYGMQTINVFNFRHGKTPTNGSYIGTLQYIENGTTSTMLDDTAPINNSNPNTALTSVAPYNNSFIFYFGLHQGATAIDKFNSEFGLKCPKMLEKPVLFYTYSYKTSSDRTQNNATIIGNRVFGTIPPYNVQVVGPNYTLNYTSNNDLYTQDMVGLEYGVYEFTVTDGFYNEIIETVIISEKPAVFFSETHQDISTHNADDGIITIYIKNGYGTVIVNIENNGTVYNSNTTPNGILTFNNLKGGNWNITILDSAGDSDSGVINIHNPEELTVLATSYNSKNLCYGGSDGLHQIHVSSGEPPLTCEMKDSSNNIVSPYFIGESLSADTYTYEVTDGYSGVVNGSFTVSDPTQPLSVNITASKICHSLPQTNIPFSITPSGGWVDDEVGYSYKCNINGGADISIPKGSTYIANLSNTVQHEFLINDLPLQIYASITSTSEPKSCNITEYYQVPTYPNIAGNLDTDNSGSVILYINNGDSDVLGATIYVIINNIGEIDGSNESNLTINLGGTLNSPPDQNITLNTGMSFPQTVIFNNVNVFGHGLSCPGSGNTTHTLIANITDTNTPLNCVSTYSTSFTIQCTN